ncbi:hypothetical protein [Flavobacterium sp. AG291]|uniref:hypothetical protein n=1 Tax=Flavobacterium sp. AG291 TaxID=2184000 RepID=UPI000E0C1014|nr:hypothetical protein [Flavobacterium sp. AG291]RDI10251.1 hypothetical protein DEU42_10867 [Flavobacterium sp. AG291]
MKLILRDHIEKWATRFDSKGTLPTLISRLVRASTPYGTKADFPSGSAAFIGGWDGTVDCQEETPYVPKGISLWEFGTEDDNKGKADDDYAKRTKDPQGYNQKDCVFIFVTPRFWKMKDKWVSAKKAEGIWKDVIVYDSSNLEQWLEITLSVSRWFSSHVGSYPFDGIMTADEFWSEWSTGMNGLKLLPDIITSGREYEQQQLLTILQESASIKGVRASTKQEAIAFIIASAMQFPEGESERFFSKSLITDTEGNFRGIRINSSTSLNLIPRFDERQPLYLAASEGHHILIPLGADDPFSQQETITLPTINREGQINSLIKSGISEETAEKFSREAGRNITIVKKLLGFEASKAKWFVTEDIKEIIPALLLGRWNETHVGDIEILEKLSGVKYTEYVVTLAKWKNFEESPIIQIGETWRLTSPLDLWTNLSAHITKSDFDNFSECFFKAFKNGNPVIRPEGEDTVFSYYSNKTEFSSWAREGLAQSLILIARFGDGLNIANIKTPQIWVDEIINELLKVDNDKLWVSINHEIPLIAEASPTSFLNNVKKSLSSNKPQIIEMFTETEGFLYANSNHTGLLWALEGLAWMPEYLLDVTVILLTLSRLDPGGSLSNRPINSVREIYKPWHFQTLATFEERMEALTYAVKKEPKSGWILLMSMMPDYNGIGQTTHKMRWRIFDKNTHQNYTHKEVHDTYSSVFSLILETLEYEDSKFLELINKSVNLASTDRRKIFDWVEKHASDVKMSSLMTWNGLRKILHHHRSYSNADWALPETELLHYEKLYKKLTPQDTISRNLWLFNEQWPDFPEGFPFVEAEFENRHKKQEAKISEVRRNAIETFLSEFGVQGTLEIKKSIKNSWAFAEALAYVLTNEADILSISDSLSDDQDTRFVHGFFYTKFISEGFQWIINIYNTFKTHGFNSSALANILIPLNQTQELWDFVSTLDEDVQIEYWRNIYPRFFHVSNDEKTFGIKNLIKHGRFFSAIDVSSHFAKELPTTILVELLQKAANEEASEKPNIQTHEIERIFESLYERDDIDNSILVNLEWLFLPIFDSYHGKRNPKILEEELSKNPKFFVDLITWMYRPDSDVEANTDENTLSDEQVQNRATQAYRLLRSWKKIPGMQDDSSIDKTQLVEWIEQARNLAEQAGRLNVADSHIGKVLATYPENISSWPQEFIFEVVDNINSDDVKSGYRSEMFNKRGFSSRGANEGGDIERGHANYFAKLAKDYKNKYPNVAEIFKKLSEGYLLDAQKMDDSAERRKLEY